MRRRQVGAGSGKGGVRRCGDDVGRGQHGRFLRARCTKCVCVCFGGTGVPSGDYLGRILWTLGKSLPVQGLDKLQVKKKEERQNRLYDIADEAINAWASAAAVKVLPKQPLEFRRGGGSGSGMLRPPQLAPSQPPAVGTWHFCSPCSVCASAQHGLKVRLLLPFPAQCQIGMRRQ